LWFVQAQFYIFEKVKSEMRLAAQDEVHLRSEVMVPKAAIGRIIGKGGQNVSTRMCVCVCVCFVVVVFFFFSRLTFLLSLCFVHKDLELVPITIGCIACDSWYKPTSFATRIMKNYCASLTRFCWRKLFSGVGKQ
jgi:hypothetical protein